MNNKIVNTILISGILLSVIWLGFYSSSESDNSSNQELTDLKAELKTLKSMLTQNANEALTINKINQKLEKTHIQLQKIKSEQQLLAQTGLQDDNALDAEYNDEPQTMEQMALQEEIAKEQETIQIETTVNFLKTELEQESIDEQWSLEIEQNFSDNFAKNAPEGSTLLETDCRTTFCRITIANNIDTDFIPDEMMGELFTTSEGFFNSTVDSDGKKITELYVSREGYNLPGENPEGSI